ncbi:MAG: hypothetical protein CM1200mP27_04980 [Chloroflexota bacterium]|nr:MAG: hypothetical protein CM1200mP27_04980 [Chloroflexota bacterium]
MWIFGSDGTIKIEGPPFDKVFVGKNGDKELKEHTIPDNRRGKWQVEQDFINSIRGTSGVTHTPFDIGVQYMDSPKQSLECPVRPGGVSTALDTANVIKPAINQGGPEWLLKELESA